MDASLQATKQNWADCFPSEVALGNCSDWFSLGNYCGAATLDGWQAAAAMGLIGNTSVALDSLQNLRTPEGRFYLGCALWMDGRETEALEVLAQSNLPEAERLAAYIAKPVIRILAQTVWEDATFEDPRFEVHRTGIRRTRLNAKGEVEPDYRELKEPFLRIRRELSFQPDLYFAHMIEWQYLPYDLASLDCPTFGLTSDLDLHIQNNAPWMGAFDEVITVGAEEWAKARALRPGPTCTYPKLFGVPADLPALNDSERDVDVFISGTMLSPCHPDKAVLLQQLLRADDLHVRYMNGFLPPKSYAQELQRSKVAFTYVRHPGSMPSRGVESLAAGCAVITQPGSALTLFAGESYGVFAHRPDQLAEGIRALLADWPGVSAKAQKGAGLMRREFANPRCISQFLRFLTIRAALTESRQGRQAPAFPHQKRVVAQRGWVYPSTVNHRLLMHTLEEATGREANLPSPRHPINAARELDLFIATDLKRITRKVEANHQFAPNQQEIAGHRNKALRLHREMSRQAQEIYRHGMKQHPDSLVLRFNFIRHGLHWGTPELAAEALDLTREILKHPDRYFSVDSLEDIMPWDYFGTFFNYRSYLDALTEGLGDSQLDTRLAQRLILASLSHYVGQYTGAVKWLEKAVEWDPNFAHHRFALAQALLLRDEPNDPARAAELLEALFNDSLLVEPAFQLLAVLQEQGRVNLQAWPEYQARFRRMRRMTFASGQALDAFEVKHLVLLPEMTSLPLQGHPFSCNPPRTAGYSNSALVAPWARHHENPERILLISFECGNWENAKAWSYNGFYALEEALAGQGVEHLTLPAIAGISSGDRASWLRQAQLFTENKSFDQAWIWITHNDYEPEFLNWLESVAPVRVGVIMESLEHTDEETHQFSNLAARRNKVLGHLRHCTHALTFDERDAETLSGELPLQTLWCPPVVGWRDVCATVNLPTPGPAWFQGTAYNPERQAFLECEVLKGLLERPPSAEADSTLPAEFDRAQMESIKQISKYDIAALEWLEEYHGQIRRIRRQLNDLWQDSLRRGFAHVNLPSIYKGYAGRVVESMAAGRPVISWAPPRQRTRKLFVPGEEILWFERDRPDELAAQIRWLQDHPQEARAIAERARQKVLRYHTAETRVRQILNWLADGTEPNYGENETINLTTEHQTKIEMNTPENTPQFETLEAALNAAEAAHGQNNGPGAIAALEQAIELGDRHPVLLRSLGTQYYLAEQFAEARSVFREFTGQCADDATGHVQYGLAAYHDGDADACVAALQQALVLEPAHPEALKLSADLDVSEGRYDEARHKYDLVAENGVTVDTLHALAFCQFKTGDVDRAINTYQQLLEFDSSDELAAHNLQVINTKQNEPIENEALEFGAVEAPIAEAHHPAENHLEQADFFQEAGNAEAAVAELEQAVAKDAHNAQLVEALGSLYFQQDRFEEARRQFRKLIELQPRSAMAYTRLAMTSYETDRFDEFESALGLAMEIDPELPDMLRFMGKVNLDQERHYDAGRIFGKLVELEPENVQNLLALAKCLYQGGQEEAAQVTFERALQLEPDNAIASANLKAISEGKPAASVEPPVEAAPSPSDEAALRKLLQRAQNALEADKPDEAITLLENLLSQRPNEVELLNALGNLYMGQGKPAEALEYFRRNADLRAEDVMPQLQAATTALLARDYDVFEAHMQRVLKIEPGHPHGLKLLATANFRAQDFAQAAQLYEQAVLDLKEDMEVILALGVCQFRLQKLNEAEGWFRRALEIDPYNATAAENLKAVEQAKANPAAAPQPAPATVATNHEVDATAVQQLKNEATSKPTDGPAVSRVGMLNEAQQLLAAGQLLESWNAALAAIAKRPFHPEAYLHLAEVALEAGNVHQTMRCLERVLQLAPEWDVPMQALETLRNHPASQQPSASDIEWPALPPVESRLSVCLIVKDEEKMLQRALESVRGIAHQIVVVDTGSGDRTVEIAKEHGAEVHHFEWCDDFSAARNYALEHVRGDWVLVLDADEALPAKEQHKLQADLAKPNYLGHRLPLVNFIEVAGSTEETGDGLCYVPRLFRNAPGLHFIGRVHEQVYSSVLVRQADWNMKSGIGTTTLHHFGYAPEVKEARDKVKRNLRLLEQAIQEQPNEPALLMNYALDLFNDGQFEKALEQDREAFKQLAKVPANEIFPEVRERLVSLFCYHLLQAELYEELAETAASQLAKDCGPTASIHYVHGLALLKLDRHEEAIVPLRQCILQRDEPAYTARFKGVEGHGPHHLLADCYARTEQVEAAKAEFETALELAPKATSPRWSYARFLTESGEPEAALKLLFEAIDNGTIDARLWSLGCNIANGHLNDSEVAMHWTDCAIEAFPEHPEIRKQRGVALLTVGRFREALTCFEQTPSHPLNEGARVLCLLATGQRAQLADPDKEQLISAAFVEWYRRLLARGQETAARKLMEQVEAIAEPLPTAAAVLRETMLEEK